MYIFIILYGASKWKIWNIFYENKLKIKQNVLCCFFIVMWVFFMLGDNVQIEEKKTMISVFQSRIDELISVLILINTLFLCIF